MADNSSHREIEAKILDIDPEKVKAKLTKLGAIQEREVDLEQVIWWPAKNKDSVRIRKSSNGTIRLTLKQKVKDGWGYNEWENEVGSYDTTRDILDRIIINPDLRLEFSHRREDWKLNNVLITINFVPQLTPFIEIEAESEAKVKETAKLLELDPDTLLNKGMVQLILEKLKLKPGRIKL